MRDFESSWLKIWRAKAHLDAIEAIILRWLDSKPYSVSKHYDADTGYHSLFVHFDGSGPLDELALIAGDCAHNLRAALEHMVYAMGIQHTGFEPPPNFRGLHFPITERRREFKQNRKRLIDLSGPQEFFIERMQPYNRPHPPGLPSILAVLEEFDNIDKHRLIHVAYTANAGGKISLPRILLAPPTIIWCNVPLKSGDPFVHFTTQPSYEEMKYQCEAAFTIGVDHIPGPTGRTTSPLQSVVVGMFEEVKRIVGAAQWCDAHSSLSTKS